MSLYNTHISIPFKSITLLLMALFMVLPVEDAIAQKQPWKRLFKRTYLRRFAKKIQKFALPPTLEDKETAPGQRVIGTAPSWSYAHDNTTPIQLYYYNLFTDLAVCEYDINLLTGAPRSRKSLQAAYEYKVLERNDKNQASKMNIFDLSNMENDKLRYLMQLTAKGDFGFREGQNKKISEFLSNSGSVVAPRDSFIQMVNSNLNYWVDSLGVGVDKIGFLVDFKIDNRVVSEGLSNDLAVFLEKLKENKLSDETLSHTIYYRLPIATEVGLLDTMLYASIAPYIDAFILPTHGYKVAGRPTDILPLQGNDNGIAINSLVKHYTEQIGVPRNKLILEFWSGGHEVAKDSVQTQVPVSINYVLDKKYKGGDKKIQERIAQKSGYLAGDSTDVYGLFTEKENYLYFEDSTVLQHKYGFIKAQELGGVGLWGLSYEGHNKGERKEPGWKKLFLSMIGFDSLDPPNNREARMEVLAENFARNPVEEGWYAVGLTFLLMSACMLYAGLRYWEVRNITAMFGRYFFRLLLYPVAPFLLALVCFNIIPRSMTLILISAGILGFFLLYIAVRRGYSKIRRYTRMVGIRI